MAFPQGIETFAGRLATFEEQHHVNKKRASLAKKKTTSIISWPHEYPKPEQLARAGFYYKPSVNSSDSVTCFLCNKALDGWDPEDNPTLEHLSHIPECGWAINVYIEQTSQDPDRIQEDPLNEKMTTARLATFGDNWPHQGKRGWKCTLKKMVESGWCYAPLPEADDCVACFYCGVSLDGWEPKDDPWEEHRRRAPECQFFILAEEAAKTRKPSKGKGGTVSKASRVSRLSTQSIATSTPEAPFLAQLEVDEADEENTILTRTSAASQNTKGRKKAGKAKSAPKSGRRNNRPKVSAREAEPTEGVLDFSENELLGEVLPDVPSSPETKPKGGSRTRRATNQQAQEAAQNTTMVPTSPPPRKTKRATATRKEPSKLVATSQFEPDTETSTLSATKDNRRTKRGVKRASGGQEKIDNSLGMADSNLPPQADEPIARKKPGRRAKKASEQKVPAEHAESHNPTQEKPDKGKKKQQAAFKTNDESLFDYSIEKAQTTAKALPIKSRQSRQSLVPIRSPPNKAQDAITACPSSSPQPSDAENQPPTSRVSLATRPSLAAFLEPPASVKDPLLSVSAPQEIAQNSLSTPIVSPSKTTSTGLISTIPWASIDLTTALLRSPGGISTNYEADLLTTALQTAKQAGTSSLLTAEEQRMTVEEWILWNAARAEEQLRGECERMISRFEDEGGRAMRVLEGVECG